ncbi:MAG: ribose-phosphate diphosphokinase [Desulfovibrionales bacterium]
MITLLSCPHMEGLAERIAVEGRFNRGFITWESFKDGFPRLRIDSLDMVRNTHVAFLASFYSPAEIFRQLAVIYEIPRYSVKSLKIVLPYYPTGTMERVEEAGEIATAATLARMLSTIPMTMSGPVQIVIFDIHALQEMFYFSDQVLPRLETAVPLLKKRIQGLENVAVAFPDEGAGKRFGRHFSDHPLVVCQKIRKDNQRIVTLKEGSPRGKHVVIVDDLVMTGGTLLESKKALLESGAAKVSCFVTHGVFPDRTWKRFVDAGFENVWLTDSCPKTAEQVSGLEPFEVLSLDATIVSILQDV